MNFDTELTIHPAADMFPQMDEQDFQVLKADIAQNGLRESIITYRSHILDGRHRNRACKELGMEPLLREYAGTDPEGFVLSMNLHRRHLNPSQRALIAARLAQAKRGGDRSKPHKCGLTHSQAAKQLNAGQRLVEKASALIGAEEAGRLSPEVLEAVFDGKIRLGQAEKIAKLPREQQSVSKNGKAVSRKRNRLEQAHSQLEQINLAAERLASRTRDFIQRAHSGRGMTPALKESALEICRSTAQRFEEMGDLVEQMPERGRDETRSQLPEQLHHQAQNLQAIPQQQVQFSAPVPEEVSLD
jgi:ParB-like chromosome segregation protein Spo0J